MSLENKIILILIFIIIILFILWRRTSVKLSDIKFQKQSLSTKYGKMTEQFMPFLNHYPYNPQNFRFIGNPIDGIQFNDNEIILIEFKTSNSRLTQNQQRIENLINSKRVYFETHRVK